MKTYLEQLDSPKEIQGMSYAKLETLAQELRTYMLEVISQNGGHLSSNLGVVELTLAIHKAFDTSRDRLIWDVGHQAYVHKILTGRREAFQTLRQYEGLSGFPKREESLHDAYDTGHSSTSIAAALGFAKARDLKKEKHHVIAVIGDGSMTGGEAYEALNLAESLETNVLVILNDNVMSIAPNVGAMSGYLNRLRASGVYNRSKTAIRFALHKLPKVGGPMVRLVEKLKENLRHLVVPGLVFHELGFRYFGPVDGHDIKAMTEMLKKLKKIQGPVLLHVLTQKGRGYAPAQDDACGFHGVGPFEVTSGLSLKEKSSTPTFTEAFSDGILALAEKDDKILGITAAMCDGTGLDGFAQIYPKRFFDVGIAEQAAVTFGTALALQGFRPVVAVYSSFLQRAYDQLIQDAALQKAPVVFAIDRAGLVGEDGPTHHGMFDLSYLRQIPNMSLLVPRDEFQLKEMLAAALEYEEGPVAIRYPRGQVPSPAEDKGALPAFQWGQAQCLREGKDLMVLAAGPLVYEALLASTILKDEGWNVGVTDLASLKPLDETYLNALKERNSLWVSLEENTLIGGLGSALLEWQCQNQASVDIQRIGLPDQFVQQGTQKELRSLYGLAGDRLVEALREMLKRTERYHA